MSKNQHRWKLSLVSHAIEVLLEEIAKNLKLAWEEDARYPEDYPVKADSVLFDAKARLQGKSQQQPARDTLPAPLPAPSPPPLCLSELVDEKVIKAVYEQQNSGSYADALREAWSGDEKGISTFRKIVMAFEAAYAIDRFGIEMVPKPRVHFLHRNLLEVATLAELGDLTHEGLVEFLDDLCPCGEEHNPEAIRKLRKRLSKGPSPH